MNKEGFAMEIRMNRSQKIILCKLLIAFGWVDQELHAKESVLVEELLKDGMEISNEEQLEVQLHSEYPLSKAEVIHLIRCFRIEYKDEKLIELALEWVSKLIKADGKILDSEKELYDKLVLELHKDPISTEFSSSFKTGHTRTPFRMQKALGRERHLDDYLNNPVYFRVRRFFIEKEISLNIEEKTLKGLCLSATLIAHLHSRIKTQTSKIYREFCQNSPNWYSLSNSEAEAILHISIELEENLYNPKNHCRRLAQYLNQSDREKFVCLLLDLAYDYSSDSTIQKEVKKMALYLNIEELFVYEKVKKKQKAV
jgi:hypothetical protein